MVEFLGCKLVFVVVDDVSFIVEVGKILGVVGELGVGKLIVGNVVIGLFQELGYIVGGEVYFYGDCIDQFLVKKMCYLCGCKIGMIFQDLLILLDLL